MRTRGRSLAGIQHPTFQFDVRGRGNIVLTAPSLTEGSRGAVTFPTGRSFLVLRENEDGPVVAEIGLQDRSRRLVLRSGSYFVIGRGQTDILQGRVAVSAGSDVPIAIATLERAAYARLVRRGVGDVGAAHGLAAGYRLRTSIVDGGELCHGAFVGYTLSLRQLTAATRLGLCTSSFENRRLSATANEYDIEIRATHTWDFSPASLDVGLALGAGVLRETFETEGVAPPRTSAVGSVGIGIGVVRDLWAGFHLAVDVTGSTHFFRVETGEDRQSIATRFALRTALSVGKHF